MSRFAYTEAITGNGASFANDEFQHQIKVLRHQAGDLIDFFDGRGGCYQGRITSIDNRKKWFQVEITDFRSHQPPPPLHLLVALPKGGKLDSIIQKSIELGVTMITPLITARTEVRLNTDKKIETRMEHWQRIAIASLKQSGNPFLPKINAPEEVSRLRQSESTGLPIKQIVFHPGAENLLSLRKVTLDGGDAVALALGPEGGFSEGEITNFCALGFSPTSLGKRILRLETAVVSALTLIQHFRNCI